MEEKIKTPCLIHLLVVCHLWGKEKRQQGGSLQILSDCLVLC